MKRAYVAPTVEKMAVCYEEWIAANSPGKCYIHYQNNGPTTCEDGVIVTPML